MATASFTWAAWDTTNAWENLADNGGALSIVYARDATDIAAKFTDATKSDNSTEKALKSGAGDSWASIFGIPNDAIVTAVQCTAWKKKLVANTKLSSHSLKIRIVDDSDVNACGAGTELINTSLGTTTDASYVAQSAGSNQSVQAANRAATTNVRLELEYNCVTTGASGSASVDQRFDDVVVQITYATVDELLGSRKLSFQRQVFDHRILEGRAVLFAPVPPLPPDPPAELIAQFFIGVSG